MHCVRSSLITQACVAEVHTSEFSQFTTENVLGMTSEFPTENVLGRMTVAPLVHFCANGQTL